MKKFPHVMSRIICNEVDNRYKRIVLLREIFALTFFTHDSREVSELLTLSFTSTYVELKKSHNSC